MIDFKRNFLLASLGAAMLCGCAETEIILPAGPKGEPGTPGLSAYEVWVNSVGDGTISDWDKTRTEIYHYFQYLKGEDGKDGSDGLSAYEVWKEYISGGDVRNPLDSTAVWNPSDNSEKDFYYFITGPKGDDGIIPYIGGNDNWWVGDTDTGITARGKDGKDGKDGTDGKDGLSAYEQWVEYVKSGEDPLWPEGDTDIYHYFKYLKGEKGDKGDKGDTGDVKEGDIPHIGPDGNWWVGDENTGVPAQGDKGDPGLSAYELWKAEVLSNPGLPNPGNGSWNVGIYPYWPKDHVALDDFYAYLRGQDGSDGLSAYELWKEYISGGDARNPLDSTAVWNPSDNSEKDFYYYLTGPKGDDGAVPYIGPNDNWWIGDEDTGVPARGKDGADGQSPHVDGDGNWWIGDENTGVPAKGKDGKDGADGKDGLSAYELWKSDVLSADGLANPGNGVYDTAEYPKWPVSAVSVADFWRYLRGRDGEDGKDGEDGAPAVTEGPDALVDKSAYNCTPILAMTVGEKKEDGSNREYVNPVSGGVAYVVTGPGAVILPYAVVKLTDPKTGKSYTWTSGETGIIYVSRAELPVWSSGRPSGSTKFSPASITYDGKEHSGSEIAATCEIPYQVDLYTEIGSHKVKMYTGQTKTVYDAYLVQDNVDIDGPCYRVVEGEKQLFCGSSALCIDRSGTEETVYYYYLEDNVTTSATITYDRAIGSAKYCVSGSSPSSMKQKSERLGRMGGLDDIYYGAIYFGATGNPASVGLEYKPGSNPFSYNAESWSYDNDGLAVEVPGIADMPDFLTRKGGDVSLYDYQVGYSHLELFFPDIEDWEDCFVNSNSLSGSLVRFERSSATDLANGYPHYLQAYGTSKSVSPTGKSVESHSTLQGNEKFEIPDFYTGGTLSFGNVGHYQESSRIYYYRGRSWKLEYVPGIGNLSTLGGRQVCTRYNEYLTTVGE